ncbi:MAG TPA: threonine/serine exporter family protein, partial [Corynebacterium sp.]|nr:threonine/serine exporter family protein [Corynebacterium sp.]
ITAVAGITPFLPGLSVYRGMYASLHEQTLAGFTNIALALAIASGLAAGVVLGEWVAARLRRPPTLRPYRAFRRARRVTFQQLAERPGRRVRKSPGT